MKKTDVHTLIIGSGAAGLNAALQLYRKGITDILILTEGLKKGTSINTGSDKQTYYKLSLCGSEGDCPQSMARAYYDGGAMHGDLALVEATTSPKAFFNLVDLGVPFPTDRYGQYAGYKTDHDPLQRATSIGPYTSREMCRALIKEIKRLDIPVYEKRDVIELLTVTEGSVKRAVGVIAIGENDELELYKAENVIFAVGGPGGLYKTSVYPGSHTGAIGLALKEGALARNLPESQFGLASTKFRWNVSGSYMQVIPRFVSYAADDADKDDSECECEGIEFLKDYFNSSGEMNSMVFLKGYQWPFDSAKVLSGSSLIDILVYIETVEKGRRVYLDFRSNPEGFDFKALSPEVQEYLVNSDVLLPTPIERLEKLNPGAINLYLDHHIDIREEKLEIAVCAQHNNGGLAADIWWQSENILNLFPVGEVNGSHGVNRPGGSALNSGQVGGYRAAEYISSAVSRDKIDEGLFKKEASGRLETINSVVEKFSNSQGSWKEERRIFQERMSRCGAFIREAKTLKIAIEEAKNQLERLEIVGTRITSGREMREYFRNRQLCFSHLVYMQAILFALESKTGSRGSGLVLDTNGKKIDKLVDEKWTIMLEDSSFREKIEETLVDDFGNVTNQWIERKNIPDENLWFENIWHQFQHKEIYQ